MSDLLRKLKAFFRNAKPISTKRGSHKSKGQSLVELAITLPVLLLLFTGMVEFGFMLNTYLSLQDAVRSAARVYSNQNPFVKVGNAVTDDINFYSGASQAVVDSLMPPDDSAARQVIVDPTRDNVLISVLTIRVDESTDPDSLDSITRHPASSEFYKFYPTTSPDTLYGDVELESYLTANNSVPVDMGLLIIEIYYSYEGVLHLPWTEPFFSQARPAMLYSSTITPLVSAKP